MDVSYKSYIRSDGVDRIDTILDESDTSFPEVNNIPSPDALTFTNGYYVNCSALFVDIRGSSQLTNQHKRPTLAKLYRVYISEMVAVMSGNQDCRSIRIVGDCVSGIFNTPYQEDLDKVFSTAAILASVIDVINYKLEKRKIQQITVGIGMDYGRALMIKAGFKGSGINDVVWMGDVVNSASKLCGNGSRTYSDYRIMVSDVFYSNLNDDNKKLLSRNQQRCCYHGNVINLSIDKWLSEQTETERQKSYQSWRYP